MIFVSHSHADNILAESLVDLLTSALNLPDEHIRCTSVPGYTLRFGKTIPDKLKEDIHGSHVIFSLITPNSLRSSWVLFELGASWALGKNIIPILSKGVSSSELPGPISDYHFLSVESPNVATLTHEILKQVSTDLGVELQGGGRFQAKLESFMRAINVEISLAKSNSLTIDQAMAFDIGWIVYLLFFTKPPPSLVLTRKEQVVELSGLCGCSLPDLWFDKTQLEPSQEKTDSFYEFVATFGGRLSVRRPDLTKYFEAGYNLLISVSNSDKNEFDKIVSSLALPEHLKGSGNDLISRSNTIHQYLELVWRGEVVVE